MLERVAAILDAVGGSAVSASELGRRTGLSVSTAHRLALSMVDYGFLRRDTSGGFRKGERFTHSTLESAAVVALSTLKEKTGETSQLWVRRGAERECLLSANSEQELRAMLPVGSRIPLPEGSAGRLLAAEAEALASVAERGWVESVGMRTSGLGSVSAPVMLDGEIIAAVCLAVPLARIQASPGADHGHLTVAAARQVTESITSAS
jgi:DNA-binding IclR family transcriptional regulator